jgi:hypothetical protein
LLQLTVIHLQNVSVVGNGHCIRWPLVVLHDLNGRHIS